MTAACWGCAAGVTPVGQTGDPVGTCWVCGVWGCFGHGERDAGSLKWHCYPSVATAVAASSGLAGVVSDTRFESIDDLEERFPILMSTIARHRVWMPGDVRGTLQARMPEARTDSLNEPMLATALDISEYLLPPERSGIAPEEYQAILPRSLLTLMGRA